MSELSPSEQKSSSPPGKLPLASIIIINYNYEKFLPRAIDSALQQTYPFKEIIVVDDGSTDNSRRIINRYGNRITPIFQENRGITAATNTGFFASQGEIIFFLDSDDIFFPQKVEEMVGYYLQVMPHSPEALIFHRLEMITEDGTYFWVKPRRVRALDGKKKPGPLKKVSDPESTYRHIQKWGFLPFMASPTSGLSLTRSLARRIFPLPEERALPQDLLLTYGAGLLGTVYGSPQVLGSYVIHGDNISLNETVLGGQGNHIHHIKENFLNDILQKINKDRIASFDDSRYAKPYYRMSGSIRGLLRLVYKVPGRCLCRETLWFSIKTLWLCLKVCLGIKKLPWLTNKAKVLAKAKLMQSQQEGTKGDT